MEIKINENLWRKLKAYAKASAELGIEIQGWGRVEKINKEFELVKLFPIPLQEGTSTTTTTLNDKEILKYMEVANFHWHTHPGMSAFFSTTDIEDINNLMKNMSYLFSLVLNEKGEKRCRLDVKTRNEMLGISNTVTFEVTVLIDEPLPDVSGEVSKKVREKKTSFTPEKTSWDEDYNNEPYYTWYGKKKAPF